MLLTKEQAQTMELPQTVWMEERCYTQPIKITAARNIDNGLYFSDCDIVGRMWYTYNNMWIGWRLWTHEPTKEETDAAEWDDPKPKEDEE